MSHDQLIQGYKKFKAAYGNGSDSVMSELAKNGQSPQYMIVACCDSRVDPALLLQTEPGDLFVVRNVANFVPPYELDNKHHGTSAALEFGICYLNIEQLIILGHSECGGIRALTGDQPLHQDDFITNWVNGLHLEKGTLPEAAAKQGLLHSYQNCLTFPWIASRVATGELEMDLWYLDIERAEIQRFTASSQSFEPLIVE